MILRAPGKHARHVVDRILASVARRLMVNRHVPSVARRQAAGTFARTRQAGQLGLSQLTAQRLLEMVVDPVQRALLIESPALGPKALIDLSVHYPDLSVAALTRLRRADPVGLSETLYRTIVLDRAGSATRLNVSLVAAAANADRLAPQQARSIFERSLEILRRPLDPYDPVSARAAGSARQAAAALLAGNSELDDLVIKGLAEAGARPSLQMLVASALKERPDHAARRFILYLNSLQPSLEQAIRFAEDCDADRGTLRSNAPEHPRLRRSFGPLRPRLWAPYAVAVLAPTVAVFILGRLSQRAGETLQSVGIEPAVAIGALGVLVAVHVLSVQLAAQRLPGPIAEATVLTPVTIAAYWTGLLTLVTSLLGKEELLPSWRPSLVASGLLLLFILLVILATLRSLRSTGVASASENVGRWHLGQARRTGRIAGKLHLAAADMQRMVDTHPPLRRFTSAHETTERYPIKAASSGYVHVNTSRLLEVAQSPRLVNGEARLDLLVAPGVAVTAGQELASLVPLAGGQLERNDQRAAERAFRVSGERQLGRFAELCAALCAQLPLLVRAGDPAGARRVHQVLLDLLRTHLDCDTREHDDFAGTLPLSPALTQVIDKALAELKNAPAGERGMLARVLSDVLDFADKDSGIVTLIAARLSSQATGLEDLDVLYDAGRRAILLESGLELASVQRGFDHLTPGTSSTPGYASETAGRLVAFCAAVAPRLSRAAWSRWWKSAARTPEQDRVQTALRIGAAALPVANLSLAVEISLAVAGQDFDALVKGIRDPERAAFESFLSEAYGRLLGVDAEQRIVDFIEFARDVNAAISNPSPAA